MAILSSPLLVKRRPVGALNIYSLTPAAFTVRDQEVAAAFATQVSLLLSEADMDRTEDELSVRFQGALRSREVIAQVARQRAHRIGVAPELIGAIVDPGGEKAHGATFRPV